MSNLDLFLRVEGSGGEWLERFQGGDRASKSQGGLIKQAWFYKTDSVLNIIQTAVVGCCRITGDAEGKASYTKESKT